MLVVFCRFDNLKLLASLVLLLFSSHLYALGMGKIQLFSYINEPLSAEIELLGVDDLETQSLLVELGSEKDFRNAGVARHYFLTRLNYDVIRFNGRTVINLSTKDVVRTPFLDFLLSLSWPDGKMVKGYTLLLDPPPENVDIIERPLSLAKQVGAIAPKQLKMAQRSISADERPVPSTTSQSERVEEGAPKAQEPIVYDRKALEKKLAEIRAKQSESADDLFDTEKTAPPQSLPSPQLAEEKTKQEVSAQKSLREKFEQASSAKTEKLKEIKKLLPPIVLFDKPVNPLPIILGGAVLVLLLMMVLVYKFAPDFPILVRYRNMMDIWIAKVYPKWGISDDDDEQNADEDRYVPDELTSAFDLLTTTTADLAQKIELARGYIEVGDEESAKEILLQVIEDGNEENKAAAQELLAEIT